MIIRIVPTMADTVSERLKSRGSSAVDSQVCFLSLLVLPTFLQSI